MNTKNKLKHKSVICSQHQPNQIYTQMQVKGQWLCERSNCHAD